MSAGDEVSLSLGDKMRFVADTPSGHEITIDSSVDGGGDDLGPRPMEFVLVALGSCMGMDTISILRKMRHEVTSYEINVTSERAAEHPRIFTTIAMMHRLRSLVESLTCTLKVVQPPKLSIGVARISELSVPSAQRLLHRADAMLYRLKYAGKTNSRVTSMARAS